MFHRIHHSPMPPVGGGSPWETVAEVAGHQLQRHCETKRWRLLNPDGERHAWGNLEQCETILAKALSGPAENPNLPFPTLGGMQFWGDEVVQCGWRIQRNAFTGHHRLLDTANVRQAWGTLEQCEMTMRRLHEAAEIEPISDRFAVLVHGILGWKDRWAPMADALRCHGFEVHDVNYPSTRRRMEDHVAQLARVVDGLAEYEELYFVCHSMGGLLVRRLLADHPDLRVKRVVMIATPNCGALTADLARDLFAYKMIFGPSGQQLVKGVDAFCQDLPAPPCEFGIIAGGKGTAQGFNPLLGEDNDGVVEISSCQLDGMGDFLVAPHLHSGIFRAPEVVKATVRFLETGRFNDEREARP
jgi:hypothetical protein